MPGPIAACLKAQTAGGEWNTASSGLPGSNVLTLAIDPVTSTTLFAGTPDGMFKTTNGGQSWSAINAGLTVDTYVNSLAINPVTPTTLYAGTGDGVFKTSNGGDNWSAFSTGLAGIHVRTMVIDPVTPSILFAGTDSGVFSIQQVDFRIYLPFVNAADQQLPRTPKVP